MELKVKMVPLLKFIFLFLLRAKLGRDINTLTTFSMEKATYTGCHVPDIYRVSCPRHIQGVLSQTYTGCPVPEHIKYKATYTGCPVPEHMKYKATYTGCPVPEHMKYKANSLFLICALISVHTLCKSTYKNQFALNVFACFWDSLYKTE